MICCFFVWSTFQIVTKKKKFVTIKKIVN
uniref:Uncharacterized protein n=1 Tax=Anguilla anguilla TaxID=7936 RepID=A0A0E9SAL3_ANGAN